MTASARRIAIELAWTALRSQRSVPSSTSNWAATKRIFEASWPSCLRTNSKPSPSPGFRNTPASPKSRPFLVPPNESRSTPASVVIARSGSSSEAAALASREPSTGASMSSSEGGAHVGLVRGRRYRRDLVGGVGGADLGRLGDRDHARLGEVLVAALVLPAADVLGGELALLGGDREQLGAGDPLGRPALVDVHVSDVGADRRLVAPGDSVEAGDVGAAAV